MKNGWVKYNINNINTGIVINIKVLIPIVVGRDKILLFSTFSIFSTFTGFILSFVFVIIPFTLFCNEFKLLIITQKQYVLNTQHENSLKTLELKYKDQEIKNKEEEIKKLRDELNKNYIKKKVYKNKNRTLEEENKNLKNQLDFLKNLILFNNTNMNKPFLNQTVNCTEIPKVIEPDIKDIFKIEDIKSKILEKKK